MDFSTRQLGAPCVEATSTQIGAGDVRGTCLVLSPSGDAGVNLLSLVVVPHHGAGAAAATPNIGRRRQDGSEQLGIAL